MNKACKSQFYLNAFAEAERTVLKDAEENGEPCLEGGQLNNREKGSHTPGHTDQEKNGRKRCILPTALPVL